MLPHMLWCLLRWSIRLLSVWLFWMAFQWPHRWGLVCLRKRALHEVPFSVSFLASGQLLWVVLLVGNDKYVGVSEFERTGDEKVLIEDGAHVVDKVLVCVRLIEKVKRTANWLEHVQHFVHALEAIEKLVAHYLQQLQIFLLVELLNPGFAHLLIARWRLRVR